jgi:hypothetical protein
MNLTKYNQFIEIEKLNGSMGTGYAVRMRLIIEG